MSKKTPDLRQRLIAFLKRHRKLQTEFLSEIVKTPSDNPPGDCRPHALRARRLLEAMDFKVKALPVPADIVHSAGMRSATNLIVRESFGAAREGPTIALNAHGDVVPPGLGWSVDPYGALIRKGHLYGRGAAVSKSDFATYAFALLALKATVNRADDGMRGNVELHLTYDEEAGGEIGPKWILDNGHSRPEIGRAHV